MGKEKEKNHTVHPKGWGGGGGGAFGMDRMIFSLYTREGWYILAGGREGWYILAPLLCSDV